MKTILVRVTREDIRKGRIAVRDSVDVTGRCPVARAIRRKIPKAHVGYRWVWIEGKRRRFTMPSIAGKWICAFDSHRPVQPFSFRLKVP